MTCLRVYSHTASAPAAPEERAVVRGKSDGEPRCPTAARTWPRDRDDHGTAYAETSPPHPTLSPKHIWGRGPERAAVDFASIFKPNPPSLLGGEGWVRGSTVSTRRNPVFARPTHQTHTEVPA
jgi:hypothetical protein